MPAIEAAGEKIVRNLQDAVERLQEDIARIELWAGALGCFTRPVPSYDPTQSNLDKFMLPPRSATASNGKPKSAPAEPRDNRGHAQNKA